MTKKFTDQEALEKQNGEPDMLIFDALKLSQLYFIIIFFFEKCPIFLRNKTLTIVYSPVRYAIKQGGKK